MTERDIYQYIPMVGDSPALFEVKMSKTDSIPFCALKEHQVNLLVRSKTQDGFMYKVPDMLGSHQFGVDGFWFRNCAEAWVIVLYYKPRKPKVFYYIEIDTWLDEQRKSPRKSLTRARAAQIARYTR